MGNTSLLLPTVLFEARSYHDAGEKPKQSTFPCFYSYTQLWKPDKQEPKQWKVSRTYRKQLHKLEAYKGGLLEPAEHLGLCSFLSTSASRAIAQSSLGLHPALVVHRFTLDPGILGTERTALKRSLGENV